MNFHRFRTLNFCLIFDDVFLGEPIFSHDKFLGLSEDIGKLKP